MQGPRHKLLGDELGGGNQEWKHPVPGWDMLYLARLEWARPARSGCGMTRPWAWYIGVIRTWAGVLHERPNLPSARRSFAYHPC